MGIRKSAKRLIKLAKKNPNLYTREDVLYAKLIKKHRSKYEVYLLSSEQRIIPKHIPNI